MFCCCELVAWAHCHRTVASNIDGFSRGHSVMVVRSTYVHFISLRVSAFYLSFCSFQFCLVALENMDFLRMRISGANSVDYDNSGRLNDPSFRFQIAFSFKQNDFFSFVIVMPLTHSFGLIFHYTSSRITPTNASERDVWFLGRNGYFNGTNKWTCGK